MKTYRRSILSAVITQQIWDHITKSTLPLRIERPHGVSITAFTCTRRDTPSGGIKIVHYLPVPPWGGRTKRETWYSKGKCSRARLECYIGQLVYDITVELHRRNLVAQVLTAAEGLESNETFLADLEKEEAARGLSPTYDDMTIEESGRWLAWVNQWKAEHPFPGAKVDNNFVAANVG